MPDNHQEVLIVIVASTLIFFVLTGILTFILVYAQQKKLRHLKQLWAVEQRFKEQMFQSQLEMQEHTFNAISQEIHDNVGQTLSLAKVQLNILNGGAHLDRELVSDIKESVGKALTDLRDVAKSLNSDRIRHSSLAELTAQELARIQKLGTMETKLDIQGRENNLSEQNKLIVFRIIQEGLQNILKHAGAKNIAVSFNYQADCLRISLADNGIGFDQAGLTEKDGLGLQNISSRATLIGGQLSINSIINGGTTLTIILPYA